MRRAGDVVLDVGYGAAGEKTLNLVEGAAAAKDLRVLTVINASRPMTATVADMVTHVRSLWPVHGLVNNTHLGDETTAAVVQEGARLVEEAARLLGVPVAATAAVAAVARSIGPLWVTPYAP